MRRGGSSIDAAKAMWIKYEYPETTFEDMCVVLGLPKLRTKTKFCAISSTSGTATEVTTFSGGHIIHGCANAIADACTGSNPRQPSPEEMEKLLECAYFDKDVDF